MSWHLQIVVGDSFSLVFQMMEKQWEMTWASHSTSTLQL